MFKRGEAIDKYGEIEGNARKGQQIFFLIHTLGLLDLLTRIRLIFFLWGHLKSVVYETQLGNEADLRQLIMKCSQQVKRLSGIIENVR